MSIRLLHNRLQFDGYQKGFFFNYEFFSVTIFQCIQFKLFSHQSLKSLFFIVLLFLLSVKLLIHFWPLKMLWFCDFSWPFFVLRIFDYSWNSNTSHFHSQKSTEAKKKFGTKKKIEKNERLRETRCSSIIMGTLLVVNIPASRGNFFRG